MKYQVHLKDGGSFFVKSPHFSEVKRKLTETDFIIDLVFYDPNGDAIVNINSGLVQFVEKHPFLDINGEIVWKFEERKGGIL